MINVTPCNVIVVIDHEFWSVFHFKHLRLKRYENSQLIFVVLLEYKLLWVSAVLPIGGLMT